MALEARPANVEGAGALDLRTLVRQALRMRPDRLVVGEVRGDEVVDLLAALNTGHEGGCGTVHANSAADVPARLEGLALAAGLPLGGGPRADARRRSTSSCTARATGGRRRVLEIGVLERGVAAGAAASCLRCASTATEAPGRAKEPRRWRG